MRSALILALFPAVLAAQEPSPPLQAERPGDWTCLLTITGHAFEPLDQPEHSRKSFGAYVSAGSGCQKGVVYVGVYPEAGCTVERNNQHVPMVFKYKPPVITIDVTPGNLSVGMLTISTNDAGSCYFNTYIASCGTAVPSGGRCKTSDNSDKFRMEHSGSTHFDFNSARR